MQIQEEGLKGMGTAKRGRLTNSIMLRQNAPCLKMAKRPLILF